MAEDYPFIRDKEVAAIFQPLGWGSAKSIDSENLRGDEAAVEAVSQGVAAGRRYDKPESIDGLAAVDRHYTDGQRAGDGYGGPDQEHQSLIHVRRALWRILRPGAMTLISTSFNLMII